MKYIVKSLFFAIILIVSQTGCISSTVQFVAAEAPKDTIKTVRLYSSMQEEILMDIKKGVESQNAGLTMEYYFASTPKILTKITTERQSGQISADIIWLSDAADCLLLKSDGILQKYKSPESESILPAYLDPDGFFAGTALVTVGIGYNTDKVAEKDVPKTWEELTDTKWRGQIAMTDPGSSGSTLYAVSSLMQSDQYGPAYFKKLHDNQLTLECNTAATHSAVAKGDFKLGVMLKHTTEELSAQGMHVAFQPLEENCRIITVSPVALIENGGLNEQNSKLLYDYILSEHGQKILANHHMTPARGASPDNPGMLLDSRELMKKSNDSINAFDEIFG